MADAPNTLYFPFGANTFSRNDCCCSSKVCDELVASFRRLNDRRGNVHKFPNIDKDSQRINEKRLASKWSSRAEAKLGGSVSSHTRQSNRTKEKEKEIGTRSRRKGSAKNERYIALWHYHPEIFMEKNKSDFWQGKNERTLKKIVSKEVLESKLDIKFPTGGCGYDRSDYQGDNALVLPCYPYNSAKRDFEGAAEGKKNHDSITKMCSMTTPTKKRSRPLDDLYSSVTRRAPLERQFASVVEEVEHLRKEKEQWESLKNDLGRTIRQANRNLAKADEELKSMKDIRIHELHSKVGCGLNRITISSPEFHKRKENKNFSKMLFGFESFQESCDMISALFDVEYVRPETLIAGPKGLSEMEQIMLTLVWTNLVLPYELLAIMFGIRSRQTVGTYIRKWMPVLGERGDMMSNLLPFLDKVALDRLEPYSYKDLGLKDIGGILDGKDFPVETCRVDRLVNCAQHSNKLHTSAFRILTWSLACGAVVERTPAFLARTSEKGIMSFWGERDCLVFPKGTLVLGDKGFDNTAACYVNYNTTLHPAFLTNPQFNLCQVGHNIQICQKRYTCEVVYSRVTNVGALHGVIPRRRFEYVEPLIGWAHGRANLCYEPLQAIVRPSNTSTTRRNRNADNATV